MCTHFYIVPIYFIASAILLVVGFLLLSKELTVFKKRLSSYTETMETYSVNENSIIEDLSEKLIYSDTRIADLEHKIIVLKADIDMMKSTTTKKKRK